MTMENEEVTEVKQQPSSGDLSLPSIENGCNSSNIDGVTEEGAFNVMDKMQVTTETWRREEKELPLKKRRAMYGDRKGEEATVIVENCVIEEFEKINPTVEKKELRCSRASGQGWRCPRKPRSGYALCEYHQAKARTNSNGRVIVVRKQRTERKKGNQRKVGWGAQILSA